MPATEAPTDALTHLEATKTEGAWHTNMRADTAKLVAAGRTDQEIHALAVAHGQVDNPPEDPKVQKLIDGAREKGFDEKSSQRLARAALPLSEDAIAERFVAQHGERFRFDPATGEWRAWSEGYWPAGTPAVKHAIRMLARAAAGGASPLRAAFVNGAEALARSDPRIAAAADLWDRDPLLLGAPAAMVDLRTGQTRPPRPEDNITRQAGVAPDFEAATPAWDRFLEEISCSDPTFRANLQRIAGYGLTAQVSEHALFVFYGSGANGKSVLLKILLEAMGDYAAPAPLELLEASSIPRHSVDIAVLKGLRLAAITEIDPSRRWSEGRLLQLTGGDPLQARRLYQDFAKFDPTAKLIIATNYLPQLGAVTPALRRRVRILPFRYQAENPDRRLIEALRLELSGILAWMIRGAVAWAADGLAEPPSVREETERFFEEQDLFGQWLAETCLARPGDHALWTPTALLFASWKAFAEALGQDPRSERYLAEELRRRGFERSKTAKRRGWKGLALAAGRKEESGD